MKISSGLWFSFSGNTPVLVFWRFPKTNRLAGFYPNSSPCNQTELPESSSGKCTQSFRTTKHRGPAMTDRNETLIQFPLSGRREIVAEFNREMITLDTVRMLIANSSAAQPQIQPAEFEKWQECRAEFKKGNSPGVATFHHEQQAGPSLDRSALPTWLRASTSVWRAEGDSGIHWKVIRERHSTGCPQRLRRSLSSVAE